MKGICIMTVCLLRTDISAVLQQQEEEPMKMVNNITLTLRTVDRAISMDLLEPSFDGEEKLITCFTIFYDLLCLLECFLKLNINIYMQPIYSFRSIGGPRLIRLRLNIGMYKARFRWNQTSVQFVNACIHNISIKWKVLNELDKNLTSCKLKKRYPSVPVNSSDKSLDLSSSE